MKKFFWLVCFLIFMAKGYSFDEMTGKIIYIDHGNADEESLIFLDGGQILKSTKDLANKLTLLEVETVVHFEVDAQRLIKSLEISNVLTKRESDKTIISPLLNWDPTILNNMGEAINIFKSFRRKETPWTQCYNRAHVWAYETKNKFNINTAKVFMFYTTKYIREFNFKWWFHVAPLTLVNEEGSISEKVLDPYFAQSPLGLKEWTKLFMQNRSSCPLITNYSEYQKNQENEYCYLYKSSMYYVQPIDLDQLEKYGKTKSQWYSYEVKRAYRNSYGFLR